MTHSWTIESETNIFDGKPFVQLSKQILVTGRGDRVDNYYQVKLPDFAIMCAVTTQGGIIMLSQYKHGARRKCLTFPAGLLEPGEDAKKAAQRELLEETGYKSGKTKHLGSFTVNGNQGCGMGHLFLMQNCQKTCVPKSGDLEIMALKHVSRQKVEAAITSGDICLLAHAALWGLARPYLTELA